MADGGAGSRVVGCRQDAPGLCPSKGLNVDVLAGWSIDESSDITAHLAAFPGDLEGSRHDPVDLDHGIRPEVLDGKPGVEGIQVFRLEAVEPVLAKSRDDPAPHLGA